MQNGSIRLTDNGARLADRLAALHRDIQKQEQLVTSKHASSSTAVVPQVAQYTSSRDDHIPVGQPNKPQTGRPGARNHAAAPDQFMVQHRSTSGQLSGRQGRRSRQDENSLHKSSSQPFKQDRNSRDSSGRGASDDKQQAQQTQRNSTPAQQSEQSRGVDQRGGRSLSGGGRGRGGGPSNGRGGGRGRQSNDDFNR